MKIFSSPQLKRLVSLSSALVLARVMLVVGSLVLVVAVTELVFWQVNKTKSRDEIVLSGSYTAGFSTFDRILGYKALPNKRARSIAQLPGRLVYDATYTTDSFGRRIAPVDGGNDRKQYALFFGCSYTFGIGVNDDETLPSRFAQSSTAYMPYNYGMYGYGPQEMLAQLQTAEVRQEVPQANGLAVYVYMGNHVRRAIGSMYIYNGWGANMPYYTLKGGVLVRQGTFTSGRKVVSQLYRWLGHSQTLKYFGADLPVRTTDTHYKTTAMIIAESKKVYQQEFNNDRFYVLIYPTYENDQGRIIPFLKQYGIEYIDFSGLFDPRDDKYRIVMDGHPSALAYSVLAQRLATEIARIEQSKDKPLNKAAATGS